MKTSQTVGHETAINTQSGFSLVEVLVAFSILVIILMTVLESRLDSIRRIEQTGDLNQLQDIVRADLANIRKQALKCNVSRVLRAVA